ncbi:MAG: Clp protease N-terminal domain-containing protein, partial [Nitrospirota bacterium]
MRLDRLTIKAQEAVQDAQKISEQHQNQYVDVEHLVLALINKEDGVIVPVLKKLGADINSLKAGIEGEIRRFPQVTTTGSNGQIYISPRLKDLFNRAEKEAERLKDEYVSTEHLMLSSIEEDGVAANLFKGHGITKERALTALASIRGSQRVIDQNPEEKYQALNRFSRNLTELARKGKLDPVIGRDSEIRRVI